MFEKHPAAIQFGVPHGKPSILAKLEAMLLFVAFLLGKPKAGNNAKELEPRQSMYPLCFQALIGFSTGQILILLGAPVGPVNDYAIDLFMRAQAESHGQLGL